MENKEIEGLDQEGCITILKDADTKVLEIRRDGEIVWIVNGEERRCEDFRDLAKAFMCTIYSLSPSLDWRNTAPEVYNEVKHLLAETKRH